MTTAATQRVSIAPDGAAYAIPGAAAWEAQFASIAAAAAEHRRRGGTVVVVQGLGFVGTAVCAALAAAEQGAGEPVHFVIGVDLANEESFWKIAKVEEGSAPIASPDPQLGAAVSAAFARGNLRATAAEAAYGLADTVVVDVDLGTVGVPRGVGEIEVDVEALERAVRVVGRHMRAEALVVIETTVPVGACRNIVLPLLAAERAARGIDTPVRIANAYERVMPGPRYLDSVRAYPRSFAGLDSESGTLTRAFLRTFLDSERAPLQELPDLESAELAKLLENSYRAANIAFVHEWTRLAEGIGVDLWAVIESIRVRAGTHDNLRYPGLGVGGYCLTKDSLLAQWGARELLGSDVALQMTLDALEINFAMPLHTVAHVKALVEGSLDGKVIALLGVSYLPDLADTRNSPSETVLRELEAAGATVRVHDPEVVRWLERPDVTVLKSLDDALGGAAGVVLAVPHSAYRELGSSDLVALVGGPAFAVDAQNLLGDDDARRLHAAGWRVSGVGKGHWRAEGLGEPS